MNVGVPVKYAMSIVNYGNKDEDSFVSKLNYKCVPFVSLFSSGTN